MGFNFDNVIERRNTRSVKWDSKGEDILPMWVADMDFEVAPAIAEAVKKRAEHGVYGYTVPDHEYYGAICDWWSKRHQWEVKEEWIKYSPGVVPAVHMLVKALTEPGDKVILQLPVYYPFFRAVKNNGCEIVENPLKLIDGRFYMDFQDLEHKIQDPKVKLLILCSPHNPVGRVWSKEELKRLEELCVKNNVIVISDEIHCDLIYNEYKHIPFGSIDERALDNSIVCAAPSKTFNLAGLQTSLVIIPNKDLRIKYESVLYNNGLDAPNIFGIEAAEAAYKYGAEWLDHLMDYLKGNLEFLKEFMKNNIPEIRVIEPEGTYLVWLDCRHINMDSKELHEFILDKGKVWLDEGYIFGFGGEGFERINIACPRSMLEEGLNRMAKAIKEI